MLAAVIAALNVGRVVYVDGHKWSNGLLNGLFTLLIALVALAAVVYITTWALYPIRSAIEELRHHLDHHPMASQNNAVPIEQELVISRSNLGTGGQLFELHSDNLQFPIGLLKISTQLIAAAPAKNEGSITILNAKVDIQFEDGEIHQKETETFWWGDVNSRRKLALTQGAPIIWSNQTIRISMVFMFTEIPLAVESDGSAYRFHLPTSARILHGVLVDSLQNEYPFNEVISFTPQREFDMAKLR